MKSNQIKNNLNLNNFIFLKRVLTCFIYFTKIHDNNRVTESKILSSDRKSLNRTI